jgi:hypothetical protein
VQTVSLAVLLSRSKYQLFFVKLIDDNYRLLKGLSSTTSQQVYDVINRGMDAGLSKTAINRQITERFQVSKSSSKRIVTTEVNKAYNNARMNTIDAYIAFGAPLAVQHISALIPTTRNHHASRHGLAFTPQAQLAWWETGRNRINCHCSTKAIAINKDGTVKNKAAQDKVIERGKSWFKAG